MILNNIDLNIYQKNNGELNKTRFEKLIHIYNREEGFIRQSDIEIGLSDIESMEWYINNKGYNLPIENIKKAIKIYRKQNEIDYFIHKNAESFLKEQFNIYLYNYLFDDEDSIWTVERINEINKIKDIAYSIIKMISKFENELKNIWLKPRFVRSSNYVVTLNKLEGNIPLVEEILNSKGFEKQIYEWQELYYNRNEEDESRKVWKEFEISLELDKDDILENNIEGKRIKDIYRYLPIDTRYFEELKWKILDEFDNLDDSLDGVLIKSDNFQALNTILPKYKEEVDLIYIDPPFNTGDDFDYKDGFQDCTWLTLMENRLELARELLGDRGSIYMHLDHNANYLGRMLLNDIFGKNVDYNFRAECIWSYSWGMRTEKCWNRKHDSILMYSKTKDIIFNANEVLEERTLSESSRKRLEYAGAMIVDRNKRKEEEALPTTIFRIPIINAMANEKMNFNTQKPEKLLQRIIKASSNPSSLVMDFFSGSGTTIATAHKLGRKWIGIEQGEHFHTINIPRMKRVLAGDTSGISEEAKWEGGGFFKYYKLEQYEDILRKSKYNPKEELNNIFYNSEKLLDVLLIDEEKEEAILDFKQLYDDIDIGETISNLTGKKIRKLANDYVIFEDNTKVEFDNIKWNENKNLRPLFWWGEK